MDFRREVLRDTGDYGDIAVFDGREHDYRSLPFVAQRVDQGAELLAVEAFDLRGEHLYTLDIAGFKCVRFGLGGFVL